MSRLSELRFGSVALIFSLVLTFSAPLAAVAVCTAPARSLEFRFLGNDGFEISDGATTILVDFPYRSGAFGYMSFDSSEHTDVDHCSYVIRCQGRSIFFSGDVEELSGPFSLDESFDVIIISSWLVPHESRIRDRFPDAKIVLSHHVAEEERLVQSGCIVPVRGTAYSW